MGLGKKLSMIFIATTLLIILSISFKLDGINEEIIVDKNSSLYEILKIQLEEKMVLKNKSQKLYETR